MNEKCSKCGSEETHRGLYGFEMSLNDRDWGKIHNMGVTKWVCKSCGNEDSDATIIQSFDTTTREKDV